MREFHNKSVTDTFFLASLTEFCRFWALFTFFHWSWMSTPLFSKCETKARQKNCQQARDMGVGLELFVYKNRFGDVARDFWFYPFVHSLNPRLPAMTKQFQPSGCYASLAKIWKLFSSVTDSSSCSASCCLIFPSNSLLFDFNHSATAGMTQIKQNYIFLRIHFALIQHLFWFLVFVERTAAKIGAVRVISIGSEAVN